MAPTTPLEASEGTPDRAEGTRHQSDTFKEGTDLLFRNASSSLVATLICSVTYGVAVAGRLPAERLYPWGALIVAVTVGRWLHARRYLVTDPGPHDLPRWRKQFLLGMGASGVIWGYAGLFLFVDASPPHQALFFIIATGLALGGVFSYPAYPVVAPTFAALALLPLALRYTLNGGVGVATGFLLSVFVVALTAASRRFSAMTTHALAARYENVRLMEEATGAKERFKMLASATSEGVFLHREGVILDVNDRIVEMVGLPAKELIGAHVLDFIPPEFREEAQRRIERGDTDRFQIDLLLPGARRVPVELVGRSVPYDGGTARVVSLLDVSCRRESERALMESRSLLLEAIDMAGLATWRYDEATDLITLGEHFQLGVGEQTVDLSEGVMSVDTFEERFIDQEDRGSLTPFITRALSQGSQSGELRVRRSSGETGYVALRLRAEYRPDGRRLVHAITYDVTERMRAFNELSEAKLKADQASRLKGRFVSLVSHDLKSPLSGVLSVLKLLQTEQGLDVASQKDLLGKAQASVEGLIGFINQLLDLSRISEGTLAPRKQFLDQLTFVQRQLENVLPMAEKKKVRIETNLATPITFFADAALLGQVLANLLSNAIKFSRPGDVVTVATEPGNRLFVQDTGVGVEPSFLQDLFKQEIRTTSFGTKGEKGSGMGLPFSADVIGAHDGTLSVESEPGKGSRFIIGLPVVKQVILLVDDEAAHRQMMRRLIMSIDGADTVEANDGKEGLEALGRVRPTMIVTDIQMPGMDGFEFITEVRRNPLYDHVPIIIATAAWSVAPKDQLDLRKKGMETGASDFVIKPVTEANFVTTLKKYLP